MEAYIYDIIRTVRGKGNKKGALMGTTPTQLLVTLLEELKVRNDFDPTLVEDFICGCVCLLYTSPSPRDRTRSRMPSSA